MQTTTYSLHIPKPCHQDWQNMQPNEEGRYCGHCSKTVVDFTQMSDAAIQQYFIERQGQGVCGRFKAVQLQSIRIILPGYVLEKRLRSWQKFLVLLLFCFGSNCMGIDVLWGGHGNALYAQTVTKAKGVAKKKKKKSRKRTLESYTKIAININLWPDDVVSIPLNGEYHVYGYTVTKPETAPVAPDWKRGPYLAESHTLSPDTTPCATTATYHTDNNPKQPSAPQPISASKAYLLPLVGRRRKKRMLD